MENWIDFKYVEDAGEVKNVQCVSKEGVGISFNSIQIANKIEHGSVINTVKDYGLKHDDAVVRKPVEQKMREVCAELTVSCDCELWAVR